MVSHRDLVELLSTGKKGAVERFRQMVRTLRTGRADDYVYVLRGKPSTFRSQPFEA